MAICRWVPALGLAGITSTLLAGCGRSGAESSAKAATATAAPAVAVTVAPVVQRPVERTAEVVGTLKGWEDVNVGTKSDGRVRKVHHDMGDRVKPGALLVELDPVDADLAI